MSGSPSPRERFGQISCFSDRLLSKHVAKCLQMFGKLHWGYSQATVLRTSRKNIRLRIPGKTKEKPRNAKEKQRKAEKTQENQRKTDNIIKKNPNAICSNSPALPSFYLSGQAASGDPHIVPAACTMGGQHATRLGAVATEQLSGQPSGGRALSYAQVR